MKTIITYFLLLIPVLVRAQVTGKLRDDKGQPIQFATASLINPADSASLIAIQTDEQGMFIFKAVKPGNYILQVSAIGYQSYKSQSFMISEIHPVEDFGNLVLIEARRELSEVVISSVKPATTQRPDGTIVNVESSIMTKGSSVLQALERSPGVALDRQNSGLTLNGKNGVQVMVNGKLLRMTVEQVVALLNGMSANDVSRIELLSNPPARYDAEGSGGVINIVLKDNRRQGTSGNISVTGGYGYGAKAAGATRLDHNTAKLHLYGSYNYNYDRTYSDFHATGSEEEPLLGGLANSDYLSTTIASQQSHNATAGLEVKTDSLTAIGGSMMLNDSRSRFDTQNKGTYLIGSDSLYNLNAVIYGLNSFRSITYSAFMDKRWKHGQKLNLVFDHINYSSSYPISVISSFVNGKGMPVNSNDTLFSPIQRGNSHTSIRLFVAQVNYTRQYNSRFSLDAGLKETYTRTNSSSGIESFLQGSYVTRRSSLNTARYNESISAAYMSAVLKPDSLISVQAGLRYEYSNQSPAGSPVSALFPNLILSRKLAGQAELFLTYSRRISRPSFSDLASYITYNGPQSVNTGNPLLKPTFTALYSIGYRKNGYSASLSFSRDKNPIARYQIVYTPDSLQMAVSPQNIRYQNNLALQINAPFHISTWWDMSNNITGVWRKFAIDYTPLPVEHSYFTYTANSTQLFKFSQALSLELSGYYNSPLYNGSKKVDGYGSANAGLKYNLKGNAGSFQLAVNDFLRTGTVRSYFGALTREAFNLHTQVDFHPESAKYTIFKLTYSHAFGGQIKRMQRQEQAGPEIERIKN